MFPYGRNVDDDVGDGALVEDGRQAAFPFLTTPSGNFKVVPDQVVFESKKLSVLVANPKRTKVNVTADLGAIYDIISSSNNKQPSSLHNEFECIFTNCAERSELQETQEEFDLQSLGFRTESIEWNKIPDLDKSDIVKLILYRITNQVGSDFTVRIGQELFSCHLLVLQCYSLYFDSLKEAKRVDIPESNVSPAAFNAIYHWMISTGVDSYRLMTRDNILDVLTASKFLGVQELEGCCWSLLDSDEVFSEDAAFQLYMKAKKIGNTTVMELMIPRIRRFFLTLVSSRDFLELAVEDVCTILRSSYIAVHGEIEIFMSAVRWLMRDWVRRKNHVLTVMRCIRFGHIAPWQLVDIRRNPENPQFTEITSTNEVTRLVEDGLAYAIVRHWYGSGTPEYYHWIGVLGLEEPVPRNWIGDDKVIITFKEFLSDLDTYRHPKALANIPVRCKTTSGPTGDINSFFQDIKCHNDASFSTLTKYMSQECYDRNAENETLYQGIDRGEFSSSRRSEEFVPKTYSNYEESTDPCIQDKESPLLTEEAPVETVAHASSTYMTVAKCTKQMSISALGPSNKNYLAEGSLFFPEREAVLVFGGVDPHSQYGISRNSGKDIYRYQPDANVWELVGELPEPRHHHSVAFLKGRVYLVGGADPRDDDVRGKSVVVSTVWSYEPVTRSWFSESGMLTPRKNFGLVVSNGKMFAIGGQDRMGRILSSVERFDPISGAWEEVAPLGVGRMGVAATKFRELIWVAGGMTCSKKSPLSKVVECYDTRQNIWFPFTTLRFPCCFGRLYTMNDSLYLIGGAGRMTERDHTTSSLGVIDVWNIQAKEWHLQAEMSIPRHGHSVAYLGTQLLIIGGVTTVYMRALSNVECFCCERGTWIRGVSNLPTTLSGHGSITLPPASLM
ncbi:actin-binding protein IPP-like [Anabrus simplex]|uniref:actin-binding protein IPP-like n=1 Tax=Anabrus simplex TaxID=316456 RepID=UPI0035A32875